MCLQTEFLGDGFSTISETGTDKLSQLIAEMSVLPDIKSQDLLTQTQQKLEQSIAEIQNSTSKPDQQPSREQTQQQSTASTEFAIGID